MNDKNKVATLPTANNLPATQSVHPGQLIQALISKPDLDTDKVMALFEIQERYDAKVAREAYHAALAEFSAICPQITYDKTVKYNDVDFAFASLAGILRTVQEAMGKCGLKVSWTTGTGENNVVVVTCHVTHQFGHAESTTLSAAPDASGKKNSIQAVKSTVSYLRRITLEAMLGLAADVDDDDGNLGTFDELVTPEQLETLQKLIAETKPNMKALLEAYDIKSLDQLPAKQFKPMQATLAMKKHGAKKKPAGKEGDK